MKSSQFVHPSLPRIHLEKYTMQEIWTLDCLWGIFHFICTSNISLFYFYVEMCQWYHRSVFLVLYYYEWFGNEANTLI